MTNNKKTCPNCGAYLRDDDKVCYVCGEVVPEQSEAVKDTADLHEDKHKTEKNEITEQENYYQNLDSDETRLEDFEDVTDYDDAEPYSESEHSENQKDKPNKKSKKAAIICTICVLAVALIAGGVCFCYFNGIFDKKDEEKTEVTIYFDKPSVNLNLMDANGVVYNWGADVDVNYTVDDKSVRDTCSLCVNYENMWKCTIPADATDVYFSQNTTEEIRTQSILNVENETVYYVTEIVFNSDFQLPLSSCALSEFNNLGVNATEEDMVTVPPTEKVQPTTVKETETATEAESTQQATSKPQYYSVSIPTSWADGTTAVEKGNCTTYYETYNYSNYQSGMLLSIYVFDSGDNSYGDMNVKKILTSSDGKKKIVVVTPTDVECNDSDEKAVNNYISLSNATNQVISSIKAN